MKIMFDLLARITGAFGVSGNEEEIRNTITEEIKDKVDDITTDALGNLFAVKKGKGKKIMIAAHMDEIGIMVVHIDEKGFIRFTNIGGVSPYTSIGQRVRFKNAITGVVSYEEKLEDIKKLNLSKMYIDIGAKSREETEKLVKIGDTACFCGNAVKQGNYAISKAMDDRCGCAVAVEALKNLPQTDNEIYFVFTVQEEIGLRGAEAAAYRIKPDIAFVFEGTTCSDVPETEEYAYSTKMGKGPALTLMDKGTYADKNLIKYISDLAGENGIDIQFKQTASGGNDSEKIQRAGKGAKVAIISVKKKNCCKEK
jgi:putative aminopeptidase FrvX